MIILASAIILTLSSNGIIGKANRATDLSDTTNLREAVNLALSEYKLGVQSGDIISQSKEDYVKEKLTKQGFTDEQIEMVKIGSDGKAYIYQEPVIPEGFIASSVSTEDEVSEGLVIYEGEDEVTDANHASALTSRNQYVWVPVPNISEFVIKDGYSNGALQQTYYTTSSGRMSEPFSKGNVTEENDTTGEYAEYAAMKASVEQYGGFYVSRYEIGKEDTDTPVTKQLATLWNNIPWGTSMSEVGTEGAVYYSRNICESDDVVSTLIYGVQWDAVMSFMKDVKNSTGIKSYYYIYDS